MSSLRKLVKEHGIKQIENTVQFDDGDIIQEDIYQRSDKGGSMLSKVDPDSTVDFLSNKFLEIAKSHKLYEDIYTCEISIDSRINMRSQLDYFAKKSVKYETETDLSIEGVQDSLDAHGETKKLLMVMEGPLIICVNYMGGGDSGAIEDVSIERPNADNIRINVDKNQEPLDRHLNKFLQNVIDDIGYNWWDNDGGEGDIQITVNNGTVSDVSVQAYAHEEKYVFVETVFINKEVVDYLFETDALLVEQGSDEQVEHLKTQWEVLQAGGLIDYSLSNTPNDHQISALSL